MPPHISSLNLKGYKPFRDTTFNFGQLEVIAGANGSGKSSLFEFLQFLRDAIDREIPPEISPAPWHTQRGIEEQIEDSGPLFRQCLTAAGAKWYFGGGRKNDASCLP